MTAADLLDRTRRLAATAAGGLSDRVRAGLAVLAVAGAKRSFVAREAPDGTPWKPLARPRPAGGDVPLRHTGQLLASIAAAWAGDELELSANGPGAALQHRGGRIVPVRAKALTIPVTPQAARSNGPRSMPGLFPTAAGLASKDGRGRLTLHWAWAAAVEVPARPIVGFSAETLADMGELVAGEQATGIAAAFGGA